MCLAPAFAKSLFLPPFGEASLSRARPDSDGRSPNKDFFVGGMMPLLRFYRLGFYLSLRFHICQNFLQSLD